jgi:hypothetical protein
MSSENTNEVQSEIEKNYKTGGIFINYETKLMTCMKYNIGVRLAQQI